MKWFVILSMMSVLLVIPLWSGMGFLQMEEGEGHHGGAEATSSISDFRKEVDEYIEHNIREDGCVEPAVVEEEHEEEEEHEGTDEHEEEEEEHKEKVVYIEAFQYGYRPSKICVEEGESYEFRMLATDVTHGASLQLGAGSKMIRLPPGVLVKREFTFTEPQEVTMYCSYYCGVNHHTMAAEIVVERGEEHQEESSIQESEHQVEVNGHE